MAHKVTIGVDELLPPRGWVRRTLHAPSEHEGFKRGRRLARRNDFRFVRVDVQHEEGGRVSRFTIKTRFPAVRPELQAISTVGRYSSSTTDPRSTGN